MPLHNGVLPYIEVHGSHRDIGRVIGQHFAQKIQKECSKKVQQFPAENIPILQRCLSETQTAFPDIYQEIEALAEAAGVETEDFFLSCCDELFEDNDDHCTCVVSSGQNTSVIGHNEEELPTYLDDLYILKATVNGTTSLSLNYQTALPGSSVMINNWGLVQCINTLHSFHRIGVPRNIVARAILDCHSLEQAKDLLCSTHHASGYNHFLVQHQKVYDFGIAEDIIELETQDRGCYWHTNHYLTHKSKSYEIFHTTNSEARYNAVKALVKPNMKEDQMKDLLEKVMCTRLSQTPYITLASIVLLPEKLEMDVLKRDLEQADGEYISYKV